MLKRFLVVIGFLLVVFGSIFGWKFYTIQQMMAGGGFQPPPPVVDSTLVESAVWPQTLESIGGVVASRVVEITPEIPGVIRQIDFESGARVAAGDLMLTLDDRVDRAALPVLEAEARIARVEFNRIADLLPKRAVSQADFDAARAKLDAANGRVVMQQEELKRKEIRAPFDGVLGIREVHIGQYLKPGDPIATLQVLDPVFLDYPISERQFGDLAVGQKVVARFDALEGATLEGKVDVIDTSIHSGTRSVRVRATLDNRELRLRPGMLAEVLTIRAQSIEVLTLPNTAISYNTYGDFVYVIEPPTPDEKGGTQRKVRLQQVKTGEKREGRVVITEGVEKGWEVVRAGQLKLRNGQAVVISNQAVLQDGEVNTR